MVNENGLDVIKNDIKYIKDEVDKINSKLERKYVSKDVCDICRSSFDKRLGRLETLIYSTIGVVIAQLIALVFSYVTK